MSERRSIQVPPRLLGAIAEATSSEEHRVLHLVMFTQHEIAACNGHVMVRYRLERPIEELQPFWISRAFIQAIVAATERAVTISIRPLPDGQGPHHIQRPAEISLETNSNLHGMRIVVPRVVAEDYPRLDGVMPEPNNGGTAPPTIGYDARYLDLMCRTTKHAGYGSTVRVTSWGGPRDPTMFEAGPMVGDVSTLRFVIMPVAPADLQSFEEALREAR